MSSQLVRRCVRCHASSDPVPVDIGSTVQLWEATRRLEALGWTHDRRGMALCPDCSERLADGA